MKAYKYYVEFYVLIDCSAAIFENAIMLGGTLTREEGHADVIDPLECQKLCEASPECEYFTIRTDPANPLFAEFPGCWLKSADTTQAPAESGTISGYKCCGRFTFVCLYSEYTVIIEKEYIFRSYD